MKPAFEMPALDRITGKAVRMGETVLQPDALVIAINRGRKPLQFTFDANHIDLPAGGFDERGEPTGFFRIEYGAALHAQRHLIVPGTRNLEVGGFVSWIAILGSDDGRIKVDPPDHCRPFTDEELSGYGEAIEGLSREGREGLQPIALSTARAMSRSQGVKPQVEIDASRQASDAAAEAAANLYPEGRDPRESDPAFVAEDAAPRPAPMRRSRAQR